MKENTSSHQKFLQTTFQKTPDILTDWSQPYLAEIYSLCWCSYTAKPQWESIWLSFSLWSFSTIVYGALNHNRVPHIFAAENHMEEEQIQRYE